MLIGFAIEIAMQYRVNIRESCIGYRKLVYTV